MELKEMDTLKNTYEEIENPKIVLVEGDSGSGKTTLIKNFYEKYLGDGIGIFFNYDPILHYDVNLIFENMLENLKKSFSKRFEILQLFSQKSENSTLDNLAESLSMFSSYKKVVIIIDHSENANSQFFGSLIYLLRYPGMKKLMLIVSYDPYLTNDYFRDFLINLDAFSDKVIKISIKPLNVDDLSNFLKDLRLSLPDFVIEEIQKVSMGNIRNVKQIIEDLRKKKDIDETGYWVGGYPKITLPGKGELRSKFLNDYKNFNENTKRVLDVAAVVGGEFNMDIISYITKFSEDTIVNSLDELIKNNIIKEKENGMFEFYDSEFQKILYNEIISSVKKRFLHKKIGEFYENVQRDIIKSALNYYVALETNKASFYLKESIDFYIKSRQFSKALDFLDKLSELRNLDNQELFLKGFCLYKLGKFSEAMETFSSLENVEKELKTKVLIYKCYIYLISSDLPLIEEILNGIDLKGIDDDLLYHVNFIKGSMYLAKNLFKDSDYYYKKALSLAEKIDNKEYMANALKNLGNVNYYSGNLSEAQRFYLKALELYKEINDYEGISRIYNNLGNLENDFSKGIEYISKALSYAYVSANEFMIPVLHYNLSIHYFEAGKIDEFFKEIEIADKFSKIKNESETRILIFQFLSQIYFYKGDFSEAIENIDNAIKISISMGNKHNEMAYQLEKLKILAILGNSINEKDLENISDSLRVFNEENFYPMDGPLIGFLYLLSNNMDKALEFLENAYKEGKKSLTLRDLSTPFFYLSIAYVLSGKFQNFLSLYEEYYGFMENTHANPLELNVLMPSYNYLVNKEPNIESSLKNIVDHGFTFLQFLSFLLLYRVSNDVKYLDQANQLRNKLGIISFPQ